MKKAEESAYRIKGAMSSQRFQAVRALNALLRMNWVICVLSLPDQILGNDG